MPRIPTYGTYTDLDDDSIILGQNENGQTIHIPMSAIKALVVNPEGDNIFNTIQMVIQDSTVGVGEIGWNDTDGTLNIGLKGGNVVLQVGQEEVLPMRNDTGVQISDGSVVKYASAIGSSGRQRCSLLTATPSDGDMYIMGVATENIDNGQDGLVTVRGLVRNVTLDRHGETWATGDILYASPTYAGGLTNVIPTAPNLKIPVCILMSISGSNYTIFVNIIKWPHLGDLHNVHIEDDEDEDVLMKSESNDRWENKKIFESDSWTPVFDSDGIGALAYSATGGYYKINKLVHLWGSVNITTGSITDYLILEGIPYAANDSYWGTILKWEGNSETENPSVFEVTGSIQFFYKDSDGNIERSYGPTLSSSSSFTFSITYITS